MPARTKHLEWERNDTLILFAVLLVAALLRFIRLDQPPSLVFDETYYAKDACLYTGQTQEFCASPYSTEISWVHPPIGKWLIAIGIKTFGYNPFGWRATAAFFGTALAALVFLMARKLFRDRWIGGIAGLLAGTDFLLTVQSRTAMLDIFVAFFVTLGFLFLILDRERVILLREHARLPFPAEPPRRMIEWRLLAGAALGAGVGIKWQAIWGLVAGAALAIFWSVGLRRLERKSGDPGKAPASSLPREFGVGALAFILIPALVYLLGYTSWFADNYPHRCREGQQQRVFLTGLEIDCREGALGTALAFSDLQSGMLDFHANLEAKHPYQSAARTWPLVLRPVAYYYQGKPKSSHILAFGNPATWWVSLAAAIWLLIRSLRPWRAERVLVAGWGGQYLPWLFVDRPAIFFFYMTPLAPFMAIGLAAALGALRELGRPARWAVAAYLGLALGVLLWFFYPIIAAVAIPYEWWLDRMWLGNKWI